jgi:hypothetical protein
MASEVLSKYLEEVKKQGGFKMPSDNLPHLLRVCDALEILAEMRESPLVIVGGDIWNLDRQNRYEVQSDWFAQRASEESAPQFIRRSIDEAIHQLSTISAELKSDGLVDLIVSDGLTGELLRR